MKTKTEITTVNQKTATEKNQMQSRDFLYWLQGLFEVGFALELNKEQVKIINDHLLITTKDHPFIDWLDGFLVTKSKGVNKEETKILKAKLEECFVNLTKNKMSDLLERLKLEPNFPQQGPSWLPNPKISPNIIC